MIQTVPIKNTELQEMLSTFLEEAAWLPLTAISFVTSFHFIT